MVFVLCLFLLSCGKTDYSETQKVVLINKSTDKILYYFESSFGKDTLICNGIDSVGFIHVDKVTVQNSITGTDRDRLFPSHIVFCHELYNLKDTMSYKLIIGNKNLSKDDSLFIQYVEMNSHNKGNSINSIIEFKIIFNSSFPNVLSKDYTMLEKFKEFYKK